MTEISPNEMFNRIVDSRLDAPGILASLGNMFLTITVAIPSGGDPGEQGGFEPVIALEQGVPFMLVLSSPAALTKSEELVGYALQTTGRGVVQSLAPGTGIIVDTGQTSLRLVPELIEELRLRPDELSG